jgi:sulfur carrier protein ThiS
MKVCTVTLSIAALLAAAVGPVAAHHSFAMFDLQKEVKLEGTVKEYQWTNPHVWIQLLTKDAGGNEVEWAIECNGTSVLGRTGWTRKIMKTGDKISVVIHPLKTSAEPGGTLVSATINGQTLSGSGGGQRPEGAPGAAP